TTRCPLSDSGSPLRRRTMYRRGFLGTLAASTAAGLVSLTPLSLEAARKTRRTPENAADAVFETWLNRITGKHKMLFDAPEPNSGMPVVWPRVWLNGNNENYGTKDAENSAVIVLRHSAIPIAMQDALWAKDKLGEVVNIEDGDAPAPGNDSGGRRRGAAKPSPSSYFQPRRLRTKSCSTKNFSYNRTPLRLRPNSANSSRSRPRRAT